MTVVAGKVQFDILVGQVDGFGRAVYGMYQCGIAAHGVNRKPAGIAEHVQHTAAVGITFQQWTVLALVYKETGFLAFQPVDMEFQTVFHGDVIRASPFQETVFRIEVGFEGECRLGFIVYIVYLVAHHLAQCIGYRHAVEVHTGGMCLHHGCAGIDVNHEPRQVVALAVYQTVSVVGGISGYADAAPHIVSYAEFAFPEVRIDFFFLTEGQYEYGDTANLKMPFGYEFLFGRVDFNNFPFLRLSVEMCDGAGKHPRVKTL